ncbi:hypothetical protein ACQJBY_009346 [Aegilops geniculata]|uniref:Uncharacterized protein n=1 Tax=Triticum turgidum subsp. durum TaxID=4567 RepID=A0A9R1PLJ2_TRITD|nr:unnamed protein product [Triticum turgidum subsp. durum]
MAMIFQEGFQPAWEEDLYTELDSIAAKIGMAFGVLVAFLFLVVFAACWWKRRQNIIRGQKLAAAREAPYAKSRTQFTRDVQMGKHHRPHETSPRGGNNESSPHLLS